MFGTSDEILALVFEILLSSTTKLSRYRSNKDPVPLLQKANVIHKLTCPGCSYA